MTKWAILGTGMVARKFVADLGRGDPAMRAVSVASRRFDRAEAFATGYGIPHAARTWQEAVEAAGVDAVYIATPPSEHERHAMLAIAAGKAVLIEKPFAADAAAGARIAAAAAAAGVFCMEAMWTRFLPMLRETQRLLEAGRIGEIRSLQGSFGISSKVDPGASLFDPARGGGALLHRGIYPLSLARLLLGPVAELRAFGRIGETGVDEDCTLILRHDSGALSSLSASLRAPAENDLTIGGTHGSLRLERPIYRPFLAELNQATPRPAESAARRGGLRESRLGQVLNQRLPGLLRDRLEGRRLLRRGYAGSGYHHEAAELARCLAAGLTASPLMPPSQSVEILELMDRARAGFSPEASS